MGEYSPDFMQELRAAAHAMAEAARVETLALFRTRGLAADNKDAGGFDPVTRADRSAEAEMRKILAHFRPDDGVLGEEAGETHGTSGLRWVLDPIDGTRGYISGTPTWGVLIGLEDETGPIYGIIDQPYIGERFEGGFGVAEVTGPHGLAKLGTSDVESLAQATILTTFPEVGTAAQARAFHDLAQRCKLTRYGMDCYGYALVAGGHVDLVVEAGLNAYDISAPIAVVQAAGGIVTDWTGAPAHPGGTAIAAATPALHKAALEILQDAT